MTMFLDLIKRLLIAGLATALLVLAAEPVANSWQIPKGPSSSTDLLYVEAAIDETGGDCFGCGGYSVLLGLAGAGFNRDNPWQLSVNVDPVPSLANGLFCSTVFGNIGAGWGYVSRVPACPNIPGRFDALGMAIDRGTGQVWWHNATADPTRWYGDGSAFTPDPVTRVYGFTFGSSGSASTGSPFYLLGGVCMDSVIRPLPQLTLNTTGPFVSAPAGYVAMGGTWDPATIPSAKIALSGGNLGLTATTAVAGANCTTAFVLGTTSWTVP